MTFFHDACLFQCLLNGLGTLRAMGELEYIFWLILALESVFELNGAHLLHRNSVLLSMCCSSEFFACPSAAHPSSDVSTGRGGGHEGCCHLQSGDEGQCAGPACGLVSGGNVFPIPCKECQEDSICPAKALLHVVFAPSSRQTNLVGGGKQLMTARTPLRNNTHFTLASTCRTSYFSKIE